MKLVYAIITVLFSSNAFADNCSAELSAADNMIFDKKKITISKDCSSFVVNFKHKGKMPIKAGGHNVVIIETKDFNTVVSKIDMKLGAETGFLPEMPEVIAKTAIIGGGEEVQLNVDTSKLNKDNKYTFLCSFPGHYAIMKGNVVIN